MDMQRTYSAARLFVCVVLVVASLAAVLPVAIAQETNPWRGEYFDNPNLSGSPVRVRYDPAIDFDWGHNKPDDGLPVDHFSVRWTATMYLEGGRYQFRTYSDDGVRLWVDGNLLIDQWRNQPATLNIAEIDLSSGEHNLRVEYYENIGIAIAMVWWVRLTQASETQRWRAEYFNNRWLSGEPVVVREESQINYDWGGNAPVPGVGADNFSVRWSGTFGFDTAGTYTFTVTVDDGVRVWVSGGLLIDQWRDQSATFSATRAMTKGSHPIVVEYYEGAGKASIRFSWQAPSAPPPTGITPAAPTPSAVAPVTGEIIVDNKDSGFQKGGPSDSWYELAIGYKNHIYWTYNSDSRVYNYAKWVPKLPAAGNYEVQVFIPKSRADTKNARYRIRHNGQEHTYPLDQSIYFDKWVSIGTYYFAASGDEHVYLDDVTGEPYAAKKIGFDAVKFVRKAGTPAPTAVRTAVPTATRVPPTAVPTATTVAPTATPTTPAPTPTLPACPITPLLGFGRIWSTYPAVRNRLGCPVELEKNTWSAEETFVNGYMFWRGDLSVIYALYSDHKWQQFVDTWSEGQQEWDPGIVPPPGFYQPKRGFGKVWREQLVQPGITVRDKLSWATTEERGLMASWQAYAGGLMLWSNSHGIFVLYYDNYTWESYR